MRIKPAGSRKSIPTSRTLSVGTPHTANTMHMISEKAKAMPAAVGASMRRGKVPRRRSWAQETVQAAAKAAPISRALRGPRGSFSALIL